MVNKSNAFWQDVFEKVVWQQSSNGRNPVFLGLGHFNSGVLAT